MIGWDGSSLASIFIRTVVIYAAILIGLRAFGKRELGQMSPLDMVVLLLLSNGVQNAMVGSDNSILGGLTAAFTLLLANAVLTRLALKFPGARRLMSGDPLLLINHGVFIQNHLDGEHISRDQVLEAMREHGVEEVGDVDLAVLEVDGTISICAMGTKLQRTRRRIGHRKVPG